MQVNKWSQALNDAESEVIHNMVSPIIEQYDIHIMKPPQRSLLMLQSKETVSGGAFNLGETEITECTVSIEDQWGFGAVMNGDGKRAYYLAIIDAVIAGAFPITFHWKQIIEKELEKVAAKHYKDHENTMKTKVSFETK
ncbi:alpha-D-ribose 1-methylphosphonate 5-triphosphate synthase subunit PhnG [Geomicrobium halophilum]|uniref:Alpha-D-ribose 1-methylphosphonate 5-triphosphate synthase subunit PhnG n=1 Tax=Geomicrobium halophilum TaxID=549000 RepID=A0A841Q1Q4_9BACL|nr:phosphonate C-P lyase system protein PhnG [Geomicrobium halophilum]MBB6449908.1 alpha-D-ribose 1-methylphosphonate 5-triphosphate synthase subunit PhnG [Geomicrobium halophilum]